MVTQPCAYYIGSHQLMLVFTDPLPDLGWHFIKCNPEYESVHLLTIPVVEPGPLAASQCSSHHTKPGVFCAFSLAPSECLSPFLFVSHSLCTGLGGFVEVTHILRGRPGLPPRVFPGSNL